MKDTSVKPNKILNIEYSYHETNFRAHDTSASLNIAQLRNLIDNIPIDNIDYNEQTILGNYKTKRNNALSANTYKKLMITLPTSLPNYQPKVKYTAILSLKNDKAVGHDHLPAEITKRHINLYANIIHDIIKQ